MDHIDEIAYTISEDANSIRIVSYINSLQDMDLSDLQWFVQNIVESNAKTIILQEHDIPLHMIDTPQGFHDEDQFKEGEPKFPVLVAYTSTHTPSKEGIAEAYIERYGQDLDPVMDESVLKIAKILNEDMSSDLIGKVEILRYMESWVFSERGTFHLEDLVSWCEKARDPNVGLAMIEVSDREIEGIEDPKPERPEGLHDEDEFEDEYVNHVYVMYTPSNASEEQVKMAYVLEMRKNY